MIKVSAKGLRYRSIFLLLVCLVLNGVQAQSLEADLDRFYSGFMKLNTLECEMVGRAYDKETNALFLEKKVKLILHDNQYFYDMGDVVCLANKKYVLMVDHTNKRIVVGKNNIGEVEKMKKKMIDTNDSIRFKSKGQVVYEGSSGGIKKYKIVNPDPTISRVNIEFHEVTGYLKKMELVFAVESKLGLSSSSTEITRINLKPQITEGTFDESAFIITDKKGFHPAAAYKGYEVVVVDFSLLEKYNIR